ncbi:uncharacterized protein CLUP02_01995, partial [Colletotrichum lupini]
YGGTSEDLPVRAWCLVCFGVSGVRNPDSRPDSKASPRHPPPSPGCLALHDSGTGHRCPGPWNHGKTAEVDEDPTIRVRLSDTRGPPSSQWTLIHWRIRLRRLSKCRLPSSIGSRRRSHSQSHRWKQYSVPGYYGSHACKPWSDACHCSVKEEEEEPAKRIAIKVLPCGWNARKTGDGRAIPSDSDKHSPNSTTTPHTLPILGASSNSRRSVLAHLLLSTRRRSCPSSSHLHQASLLLIQPNADLFVRAADTKYSMLPHYGQRSRRKFALHPGITQQQASSSKHPASSFQLPASILRVPPFLCPHGYAVMLQ